MDQFTYLAKQTVQAAQWTGHNLSEMKDLLEDVLSHNPWDGLELYVEEIEPYFLFSQGLREGYNVLKFYASGDDMEVDPGIWVVVYSDGEIELMEDEQFNKMFAKK